ncbi:MAG: hypothetical protein ACOY3Y_16665 [Acidobacteriota bacterium]
MRRIEPAFPDLLPVTHRLGALPVGSERILDPVEMRLVLPFPVREPERGERTLPRRPVRLLVHASAARANGEYLAAILEGGSGAVVVLDSECRPTDLPAGSQLARVTALAPWLPDMWGGKRLPELGEWRACGASAGVLLGLAPVPRVHEAIWSVAESAAATGAEFLLAMPLCLPAEDRHRVYDRNAGEKGDGELEDLLFHTDLAALALDLEREATRAALRSGLREGLPGPATSMAGAELAAACNALLLWARRLDLLDGVGSAGWQLRRAARALLATGRAPAELLSEDNLRIVPGFDAWVEAFARALWSGQGEPFDAFLARWIEA